MGSMMTFAPDHYLDSARGWAARLEALEMARGRTRISARQAIAGKAKISPGTLENLMNGRLKSVAACVFDRLAAAVTREIRHEIESLEHELEMARASSLRDRDGTISQVVADLEKLRAVIADHQQHG